MKAIYNSLIFFLFSIFYGNALACLCGRPPDERRQSATVVFVGKISSQTRWTLVSVEDEKGKRPKEYYYGITLVKNTFRVLEVLKGPEMKEIVINSGERSDCDLRFRVGETYKIYASDHTALGFQTVCSLSYEKYPWPLIRQHAPKTFSDKISGAKK